jgi:NAD(P)-dependent dehydrogenase (short-subunit alcohol dehydrogenase family)
VNDPVLAFAPGLFRGQVALVTGGGTGIGRLLSLAFARLGAKVTLASRKPEHLEAAAAAIREHGGDALAVQTDIREPAQCERMVQATLERYGRLDILVNNAGANFLAPALQITPNGWRTIVDIVLSGTFFASQAAARAMIDGGGGKMVMNCGANGISGSPLMAHSGVGKAGMMNLVKTLAVEWAPFNIRVNGVAPGAIETSGANERLWPSPEVRERYAHHIPMRRFGTAEDVVGSILFLCTDAASYITGTSLVVDGGSLLRTLPEA